MKRLTTFCIYLACSLSLKAAPGPGPKPAVAVLVNNATTENEGAVRFQFKNLVAGMEQKDSILIIFDRYDHTGAGIVRRLCAADNDQSITIPAVPPGKYYVTFQCVGLHRDYIEKIITIRSQKSETVQIELTRSEAFSKDNVFIPSFHPDPSNWAVVRLQSHE